MTNKRILVTGATGFVGRHLVAALLARGSHLSLAVRSDQRVDPIVRSNELVRVICCGDLADAELSSAFTDIDRVVHVAGLAHVAKADADSAAAKFEKANVAATKSLVMESLRHDLRTFINISSIRSVAGNTSAVYITDDTNPAPDGEYGKSKLAAERIVSEQLGRHCMAISLRPPLIVGADARGNWANLQKLARSGLPLPFASIRNQRHYLSIQTLIEALCHLLDRPARPDQSGNYCIADPQPITLPALITQLRRGMGLGPRLFSCPPFVFDWIGAATGRRRQLAALTGPLHIDATRFNQTFEFESTLSLDEAIRISGAGFNSLARSTNSHRQDMR
ncbi:NAD-dependent epimerase/dehydratase family protein [Devosia algicola]|uniref:NAD-dependent epimerase/dehydratase family protein n=1 Tax=Devosia algicola TaxID=3026418 RepID=A0ABY7YJT2_9HYPH|nr:NAD-dependent epimerase/dehydratase family protein [Devosia algicola]WDR01360.1 NAD-dependent epimerase/dehydratase family protein [Devosia algicola]